MSERKIWIDMLKGYGIFVVTLGHLGIWYPIEKHIYSYHMFLFFLIFGFLYNEKRSVVDTIRIKFRTLFVPFVLWDVISSLVGGLILGQNLSDFISTLFMLNGEICFNAPIWFLIVLFFVEILYAIVGKIVKNDFLLMLVSILAFCMVGTLKLPLKMNVIPMGMIAYIGGHSLKKIRSRGQRINCICLVVMLCLSILFGEILNERISYTAGSFGNFVYCIIAGMSGALFFFFLFDILFNKIEKDNILSWIGKKSLPIMTMQYWCFTIYNVLLKKLFGIRDIWHMENSLKAIIMCVGTIFLISVFVEAYNLVTKDTFGGYVGALLGISENRRRYTKK
mgnify:CR=1 FL=1